MSGRHGSSRVACGLVALAVGSLLATATPASAAVKFTRVNSIFGVGTAPNFGMARTANGTLHLITQTNSDGTGLTSRTISPSGVLGPAVSALSSAWGVDRPGLTALPNGSLLAAFGAVSPGPDPVSSWWTITSTDGGATWSAPVNSGSGTGESTAYSSNLTAQTSNGTPVVTLSSAGQVIVQQGLGLGAPTATLTTSGDDFASDVDSATDAASGQVVVSWNSGVGSGAELMQSATPTAGTLQAVPGKLHGEQVLAGRDGKHPGVFTGYTTDGQHVRLLRYGGGSVAVGKASGVNADAIGVATGPDGRIWVMWGKDGGPIEVTRSNEAVTKFEPIQRLSNHPITLFRLSGDGRLGPLDLLADETADTKPVLTAATYDARVKPVLTAAWKVHNVKNKQGHVTRHHITVTVTDAGDAVSGATVKIDGHTKKTNAKGVAKITLSAKAPKHVTAAVTCPTYNELTHRLKL